MAKGSRRVKKILEISEGPFKCDGCALLILEGHRTVSRGSLCKFAAATGVTELDL